MRRPRLLSCRRCLSTKKDFGAIVCGGGPSGLVSGLLLKSYGVDAAVIEPFTKPSPHPRAHVVSARTMEILRELGAEDAIRKVSPVMDWTKFRYCDAIDGTDLGIADHAGRYEQQSPCGVAHVSQPLVEQVLRERLSDQFFFGRSVTMIDADKGGCRVTLDDGTILRAPYVVGADGPRGVGRGVVAGSWPHQQTELLGEDTGVVVESGSSTFAPALQHFVSIHFTSRNLGAQLLDRAAMLYFIFSSTERPCVVVAHDLEKGIFNLQWPYFPPFDETGPELAAPGRVDDVVRTIFHTKPSDLEIQSARSWAMRGRIDNHFVDTTTRVFLVGDAAHEMPPSGGFGLNTAIQDAHNLSWKLATGDSKLLLTYEAERRPAAAANVAIAIDNWRRGLLAAEALGSPPSKALDTLRTGLGLLAGLGPAVGRSLFKAATTTAFSSTKNRAALQRLLADRRELPLFFPGVDLGFSYNGASALDSARSALRDARHSSGAKPYVPAFRTGARLPHFFVDDHHQKSSLDVVATAARSSTKPALALLMFDDSDADALRDQYRVDLDIRVVRVVPHGTDVKAVLVRPDGYIANVWS